LLSKSITHLYLEVLDLVGYLAAKLSDRFLKKLVLVLASPKHLPSIDRAFSSLVMPKNFFARLPIYKLSQLSLATIALFNE
jgi:hypothetical protein